MPIAPSIAPLATHWAQHAVASADDAATAWCLLDTADTGPATFVQAWQQWELMQQHRPVRLHYVAAVQAPQATGWSRPALQACIQAGNIPAHLAQQLLPLVYGLLPGVHRLVLAGGAVQLTLWVGDIHQHLRQQHITADRILLEPLASIAQPQHWLKTLARHCRIGTRITCITPLDAAVHAAFSANGFAAAEVDTDITQLGNTTPLEWRYAPRWTPRHRAAAASLHTPAVTQPGTAVVVGGGLAGSAAAFSLAQRGWHVTVLVAGNGPADGASGLPAGLFCPHVSPDDSVLSRLSRSGVRMTLERLQQRCTAGVDWAPSGVLEHCTDGGTGLPAAWPQGTGTDWSAPATASQLAAAGLPADTVACWHHAAGWVRPQALVHAQLQHPRIQLRTHATVAHIAPSGLGNTHSTSSLWQARDAQGQVLAEGDILVLAAGADTRALLPTPYWPLQAIRGQITLGMHTPENAEVLPPFPVNGNGNLVTHVPQDGAHGWIMGSTFERDVAQLPISPADQAWAHKSNWQKLAGLLPASAAAMRPWFTPGNAHCQATWGRVRCASHDRLPIVGPVPTAAGPLDTAAPSLWALTALGSRGLTLSVLCAELLAAQLHGEPLPLDEKLAQHLHSTRLQRFEPLPKS